MKRSKLPPESYAYYLSLGADRSYGAVAKHFGVTKRTVTRHALKEQWQQQVLEHERKLRERSQEKAIESLEAMNERHLKLLRVIQAKALETLKSYPLTDAMDAVRALDLTIKHERVIRGEPSDRTAVDVEALIKNEYQRWLVRTDDTPRN
ncbi:MAG: hypothetical protein IPN34_20905 [Planctomycetes bacterium]|nr:hypothetical protein [Planctomycetota bacterium]